MTIWLGKSRSLVITRYDVNLFQ